MISQVQSKVRHKCIDTLVFYVCIYIYTHVCILFQVNVRTTVDFYLHDLVHVLDFDSQRSRQNERSAIMLKEAEDEKFLYAKMEERFALILL